MLQLISRRFLRELDEAPGGNNLQYILKCPCILLFSNQGLHNEIMLGGNGVTPLENFLQKCSMGYNLYPWISLLEFTLETSYKPQT